MSDFTSLVSDAETYFEDDLNYEIWQELETHEKNGAIKLAIIDVKALINSFGDTVDLTNESTKEAIFEQAIFLVIQHSLLNASADVNKHSINNIGSTSYFQKTYPKEFYLNEKISPRTLAIVKKHKKIINLVR